jgi:hypothetical protein
MIKEKMAADDEELLKTARELLDADSPAFALYKDLILEVLRIMLASDHSRPFVEISLSPDKTTELEGKLYDRIATVIGKTWLEQGEAASLSDDRALEIIRELLLDFDEFIIMHNRYRFLRRWRRMRPRP